MSALEQIRALFEYNEWANKHLLETASALSEDELVRDLGASFGGVKENLQHTLAAQVLWLARWAKHKPAGLLAPDKSQTLPAMRDSYGASHDGIRQFVEALTETDLAGTISYVDTRGAAQERVLWQVMLHVVNHGTHHRAETALLLTSLGRPPRELDYVFFELERA